MAQEHEGFSDRIMIAAIEVHRRLGPGIVESVSEKALVYDRPSPRRRSNQSESLPLEAVPAFLHSSCKMNRGFCSRGQPVQCFRHSSISEATRAVQPV
jgi:hypothetical protein